MDVIIKQSKARVHTLSGVVPFRGQNATDFVDRYRSFLQSGNPKSFEYSEGIISLDKVVRIEFEGARRRGKPPKPTPIPPSPPGPPDDPGPPSRRRAFSPAYFPWAFA